MTGSYRDAPALCPACEVMMEEIILHACAVDRCRECHGAWLDWYDGQLAELLSTESLGGGEAAISPKERRLDGHKCPRCQCALTAQTIGRAFVYRCGDCGGAFVERDQMAAIVGAVPTEPAPKPEDSPFARFLAVLRSLVGG